MSTTSILVFATWGVLFALAFFFMGWFVRRKTAERVIASAEKKARQTRDQASKDAEEHRKRSEEEAQKYLVRVKQDAETREVERRRELDELERQTDLRGRAADKLADAVARREKDLTSLTSALEKEKSQLEDSRKELSDLLARERDVLQRVSGVSAEDAKRQLLKKMEVEVRSEASLIIKTIEEETKEIAEKKAKNILALSIQRLAAEQSIENTVSVVSLPSEEMKGRIIGKEGRNIRTFEIATGVDLVIDDTPGAVVLSAFDAVRREIARIALERLIEDGRIHPSSIEETVGKVRQEIDKSIREDGEKTIAELNLGDMHVELKYIVGRLKYRTSYGQNSLLHSKEVANMMNIFAGELGLDPAIARRSGLLHDIGKAVSHEVEGPHALIGGELARRYGESADIVHAIEAHHGDIEQRSLWPILVQAADAVSGARPGARRETLENYIRRLEKLEKTAAGIPGVDRVFAIQAGREVRVLVHPDKVADNQMPALAREISRRVKEELQFPGQIKVTVIRETRATEFVK